MTKTPIHKFERDMLHGEDIHVRKKEGHTSFRKHWHNYFEIIYYRGCHGYCLLNGKRYDLSDSCLFFLTPTDFHEIDTRNDPHSSSINVSFDEQVLDPDLLKEVSTSPIVLHDLPTYLSDALVLMDTIFRSDSKYRCYHLKHLLNHILICILELGQAIPGTNGTLPPMIRESVAYMLAHPAERLCLATFSQRFGVTQAYFSKVFHKNMGVSFKEYLTELRINCAKRMLMSGSHSIIDIGYDCGYATPSQFTRSFKEKVGITPSQYRTQYRENPMK